MRAISAAILLTFLAFPARADEQLTAGVMLEPCRDSARHPEHMPSPVDALNQGICLGFFVAISAIRPALRPLMCIPDNVNVLQMTKVAVRYFEQNPDKMNDHFIDVALDALVAMWPCRGA
jgi:hypothetical protein